MDFNNVGNVFKTDLKPQVGETGGLQQFGLPQGDSIFGAPEKGVPKFVPSVSQVLKEAGVPPKGGSGYTLGSAAREWLSIVTQNKSDVEGRIDDYHSNKDVKKQLDNSGITMKMMQDDLAYNSEEIAKAEDAMPTESLD